MGQRSLKFFNWEVLILINKLPKNGTSRFLRSLFYCSIELVQECDPDKNRDRLPMQLNSSTLCGPKKLILINNKKLRQWHK
jgi:hypothetical protein